MSHVELTVDAMATGGDAVGRDADGRATFVTGALPGERVTVAIERTGKRHAQGRVLEVLDPSPDRRTPPCPHVAEGCGGCGWQHVDPGAQRRHKLTILTESLERLGGLPDPDVRPGPTLDDLGYRTTVRAAVVDGHAGFHRPRSHDAIAIDECLTAHPMLADLFAADYRGCEEVTLRVGVHTGERLVLAMPHARDVVVPEDAVLVGTDEIHAGRHAWFHEIVDGRTWRISATSFFQTRPDGAQALIDEVDRGLQDVAGRLVDLCCGVGLLGGALAAREPGRWELTGVERHRPAVHDARENLADLDGVRIVRASMDSWRPRRADAVVADPARAGLGRAAVGAVAATGAARVVLVSCDPGALGRDAGLLLAAGYRFDHTTLVDLFAQTPHIEAVSVFTR
ncbi:MAG TPA: methyltransferase [Acidimicrobiales bacterium]|nr:methyltransferase [Acidimicrobiales bacterium]